MKRLVKKSHLFIIAIIVVASVASAITTLSITGNFPKSVDTIKYVCPNGTIVENSQLCLVIATTTSISTTTTTSIPPTTTTEPAVELSECLCTNWTNTMCGNGDCQNTEMQQIGKCIPASCKIPPVRCITNPICQVNFISDVTDNENIERKTCRELGGHLCNQDSTMTKHCPLPWLDSSDSYCCSVDCESCGYSDRPCCGDGECSSNNICIDDVCESCGGRGEQCCDGDTCYSSSDTCRNNVCI